MSLHGSHTLHPIAFPLYGSRLIEASAGTGKTWTIAALYLRLVLGHGDENAFARPLMPPEILVMTFTRAATRELSDRIRARLVEAVACFRGERNVATHDDFLQSLIEDYPVGPMREHAAWRLAMAAQCMDDAAIFTIDAWCQRVLREHAFDSGNLFDETLEVDEDQRLTEATQDYWRQQCYPLEHEHLTQVLAQWRSVDALVQSMRELRSESLAFDNGATVTLAQLLIQLQQARAQALAQLAQGWAAQAQVFEDWLDHQLATNKLAWDGRKLQAGRYKTWLHTLSAWAAHPYAELADALKAGATRLIPAGLQQACRQGAMVPLPPQSYALQMLLQALAELPDPAVAMRLHAATQVRQRLQWLKHQAGTFGFADMLERLDAALCSDHGAVLRARILGRYPVALLDEFQDTSPLQYRLFEQIYRPADSECHSALLLIGDPKQSIYGFRGADIYSYLRARQATMGRHYVLDTNYRSTHALVAAVNAWFEQAEMRDGAGAFMFRTGPDNPLPFTPVRAQGRSEQLQYNGQLVPALQMVWHSGPDDESCNAETLRKQLAQACAEQIVQWLGTSAMEFVAVDGTRLQRLRPCDIAVLVRTGHEAAVVRQQLLQRGVASVYLSDQESVFTSAEAQDLLFWLQAVATPLDARAVRAGLATRLIGLSLSELAQLVVDDDAFDAQTEQLRQLHGIWQRQGVLAMLRQTLHRLNLPARWLSGDFGSAVGVISGERRLTNYLHLAELLQDASAVLEGEQALIRWLAAHVEAPGRGIEEQIVRLESDADLVQVVTVHKSKGLEYPVVCLPFASDFRARERRTTPFVRLPQADGVGAVRLGYSDEELMLADQERLREDLRLFYVALTRSCHMLWIGLGALRKGNSDACINHLGPSGYLLAGDVAHEAAQWYGQLQMLAQTLTQRGVNTLCTRLKLPLACTRLQAQQAPRPLRAPRPYTSSFDRHWSVGSFSALVRAMGASSSTDMVMSQPMLARQSADDEQLVLDHEAPLPVVMQPLQYHSNCQGDQECLPVWHRFMRGALVGNFIHDQMEWLAQEDFVLEADGVGPQADHLRRRCAYAGREVQADDVVHWMSAVVHHRIPAIASSLAELAQQHAGSAGVGLLPEMEFWLPLQQLPAQAVDVLCRQHILPGQERPALPQRSLHGMLLGFTDMVFVWQGRFWIMDYKTNYLGPDGSAYDTAALSQAMLKHRYDVQAALYLLALHRLLQHRLGALYAPDTHLGGALYFFLRGLDGPAQAVHTVPVMLPLLHGMEDLLKEL